MITLHSHNKTTYENLQLLFQSHNRVACVQPTGTGKSFVILRLVEDNQSRKIVIIAPSIYIFTQIKTHAEKFSVNLDNVTFITYAKLALMNDKDIAALECEYIVLDEFHRCGASEWGDGVNRLLEFYINTKVLGTSATPIRYLDNCRNMAEEIFNDVYAVNMSLGEAIGRGILPNPIYVAGMYSFSGEIERLQAKVKRTGNEKLRTKLLGKIQKAKHLVTEKQCGIDQIFQRHVCSKNAKYIIFCSNSEQLEKVFEDADSWFERVNPEIHKYVVLSSNRNSKKSFDEFQNDSSEALKLLFCVDMLNEGVHAENIEGVVMLRSTESPNVYFQQLGRALTAGVSNDNPPIIFDIVNNFDNGHTRSLYKILMNQIRESVGDDSDIDFTIYDYITDIREVLDTITSELNNSWDDMFRLLRDYFDEYRTFPPKREFYRDLPLGTWCVNQRTAYKQGELSDYQINSLNELDFVWDVKRDNWQRNFAELKKFYDKHGRLPSVKENSTLVHWKIGQLKRAKNSDYPFEYRNLLESVGINFEVINNEDKWNYHFVLFQEFMSEFKRMPQDGDIYKGDNLGSWKQTQITMYKNGQLSEERIKLLNEVGFVWDALEEKWLDMFEVLKRYKKQTGEFPFDGKLIYEKRKLGQWCNRQRLEYKKGKLPEKRLKLLRSIDFEFLTAKKLAQLNVWNKAYSELQNFININGRLPEYGDAFEDCRNLKIWCNTQQRRYESGELDSEQIKKLQELGVLKKHFSNEEIWNQRFEKLVFFKKKFGRLPYSNETYEEDNIGIWLRYQLKKEKSGKLKDYQREKLLEIGVNFLSDK